MLQATFWIDPEDAICMADSNAPSEAAAATFGSERELAALIREWPLRRLVALWNRLPGVAPVRRFENRSIAIGRIWRALQLPASKRFRRSGNKRSKTSAQPRKGSKAAVVIDLLRRPQGATLQELMEATQWQAHSVRGFLSGNLGRKRQLKVRLVKQDGRRSYRLTVRRSEPVPA